MAFVHPRTYAEWRQCITVDCGIELTADYIQARITALRDNNDSHTSRFVTMYGDDYRDQVVRWFEQAASD